LHGVSDLDTPHQLNANWIIELPFGKGKPIARNAGAVLDAFIGGWQLSGIARWTSGFPVNVDNGYFFPTNWELEGNALTIVTPKSGAFKRPDGTVEYVRKWARSNLRFYSSFILGQAARETPSAAMVSLAGTWG
jgi:hypothetical protein